MTYGDRMAELRLRKTDFCGLTERRGFDATGIEVRNAANGDILLSGHAATVNDWYEVGDVARGGFRERIAPGAFRRTLSESPDLVLNAMHGRGLSGLPLARTKNGSLRLAEDARGLRYEADLQADDPDVMTLVPKLRRGDLDGASFAFRVTTDEWNQDRTERTIKVVTLEKGDISVVDFGANPNATAHLAARSAQAAAGTRVAGAGYRQRLVALGGKPIHKPTAGDAAAPPPAAELIGEPRRNRSQKDRGKIAQSGEAPPVRTAPWTAADECRRLAVALAGLNPAARAGQSDAELRKRLRALSVR